MIQNAVNLAAEFPDHHLALDKDRAAATIGAGGHQRHGAGVQQQLMERGIGEHDAKVGDAGGDPLGQRRGCQSRDSESRSSLMRLRSKVMGLA